MPEMGGQIIVKQLEFRGRCGVTPAERARPQPLAVDLELDCHLNTAGLSDDLQHTIDYAKVAQRIVEIGTTQETQLLEALAERFLSAVFDQFPVDRAKLWLRKLHPPITHVTSSVGISIERTRVAQQLQHADPPPALFLTHQLHRLPKGKVLDVACGRGRHSLFLASLGGFQVDAVDRDGHALDRLAASARARNLIGISVQALDLEQPPSNGPRLGQDIYDAILVFFYLSRPLFPYLLRALKPGGVLVYETFTLDNYLKHNHPKHREFCLAPNELLELISDLRLLHYDEGLHPGNREMESVYTAQLIAQKTLSSGAST